MYPRKYHGQIYGRNMAFSQSYPLRSLEVSKKINICNKINKLNKKTLPYFIS